ncbi:MAG: hypothetical protein EZS28_013618 [Streblomastix strix]|uniref:Uncharacterized protein n=1 Tax=Streblomastix strix TaxID=222440 RepID=A0A5J4W7L7_9EUKA|nr:MAG: hypothetical protein EZS28_013618 [Streblomastix strix]
MLILREVLLPNDPLVVRGQFMDICYQLLIGQKRFIGELSGTTWDATGTVSVAPSIGRDIVEFSVVVENVRKKFLLI